MKSVALLLVAVLFLFGSEPAQAQWSRGGSGGGGWGGSAGRSQFGAPAGQPGPSRQAPASPRTAPASPSQAPAPARQAPANAQQMRWNSPSVQPQTQVIPGRPSVSQSRQKPVVVAPRPLGSRWIGPFAPSIRHHGQPDRFFRHRHWGGGFLWAAGFGETIVITQVAPGVIREERRYLEDIPADARVREPGQLAPYDPTPQEVVERMLVLAQVKKNDVIYDLGSGDGRLLITAAKKYGVRGVGFEIEPGLVKLARENAKRQGVEKLVTIRQQDFLSADLSPATVVTLYLSYDGNLAVREQLNRQLKPGARVVSYTFDMGDWPPKIAESYRDAAGNTHAIYLWQIIESARYSQSSGEMLSPQPTRTGPLIIEVP